jgi:uncharacterized protein (DUF1697 family)
VRTWVLLLRGINLGARNRVAMVDLRALLEGDEVGGQDVRTLLQSGNAVLRARARPDPAALEALLARRTGARAPVVVLSADELRAVAEACPLAPEDPRRLLVAFLGDPTGDRPRLEALTERDWAPERLALGDRAAYLWLPDGVRNARLPPAVERAAEGVVTARNWATVTKLLELADG